MRVAIRQQTLTNDVRTMRGELYQVFLGMEVDLELTGMDGPMAREVLTRLQGLPGVPEIDPGDPDALSKIPPVEEAFPRRLDL